MINDYGLNQKEAAERLGITPAAVSQYLSGKGGKMSTIDKELCNEMNISAKRIIQLGDETLVSEICRLCNFYI